MRDWEDVFFPFVFGAIIAFAVVFMGYKIWFYETHHCSASHVEHVPEHEDMIEVTFDPPTWRWETHLAHDEVVCDEWEANR